MSSDSNINLKMGSMLKASGSHAKTRLMMFGGFQSVLTLGGLLGLDAAGSEAISNLTVNYQTGSINFNGGASVIASGDAAEAQFTVTQNYPLLSSVTSTIYIGNQMVIDAAGTKSKANASFVSDSKPTMQIAGVVRLTARGDDSKRSFWLNLSKVILVQENRRRSKRQICSNRFRPTTRKIFCFGKLISNPVRRWQYHSLGPSSGAIIRRRGNFCHQSTDF